MSVRLLSLLLVLALSVGCHLTMPIDRQYDPVDYGLFVGQIEAQILVRDYMRRALYDPRSARYRFGCACRGFLRDRMQNKVYAGYVMRVHVDAKNRKGEYTGELLYTFLIRDGRITVKEFPPVRKWSSPSIYSPSIAYILRE